jgi:hypothetical protein
MINIIKISKRKRRGIKKMKITESARGRKEWEERMGGVG